MGSCVDILLPPGGVIDVAGTVQQTKAGSVVGDSYSMISSGDP